MTEERGQKHRAESLSKVRRKIGIFLAGLAAARPVGNRTPADVKVDQELILMFCYPRTGLIQLKSFWEAAAVLGRQRDSRVQRIVGVL